MKTQPPPQLTPSTLYPSFYYDDAQSAIDWLCKAFGFRKRLIVPGPDGAVMHSELTFGPAVIMVATSRPSMGCVSPKSLSGINSATSLYVEDPDRHFAQAKAAGAFVLCDIKDEEYGGRGYMVRDPEGNQWYFGSYRPGAHWNE
jgi:uncharacterized glyoxalase superfamily protein PhnB